MMTAAEVTLKSPSILIFQRRNFLHRTLTPLGKEGTGIFLGGVRRELFGKLLRNDTCRLLKKVSEARRAKNRRADAYSVRWSEAIERNEAYESFSAACLGVMKA